MKTLSQLCTPRDSVFDQDRRDVVLDLTDLIDDKINPADFFTENYRTGNMQVLFREAFRRFQRKTQQSTFLLTQAMGGGKTHNMIALGLLARYPEYRNRVMGADYEDTGLGKVRVVGFTGRESDAKYGIWGAIAEQLGKRDQFSEYYSPLQAPGQTAWQNLLKGEPTLILLDELPPYFAYIKSKTIGDSTLARVTATALSNLLVAANKLDNVCVVISDLQATYGEGSQQIITALNDFENEVGRSAMRLEPVSANTDEVYHILKKRLFDSVPDESEVDQIAQAYAKSVRDAKQMDVTNASPEEYARRIKESYPFHFSLRDLYARFKENPGFQQTRGLIRLMRIVVSHMYRSERAEERYLVHPYDIDLNHKETFAEVTSISSTLTNAISHDIASEGSAIAETIDSNLGGHDAQDAATLLLISSLSEAQNAVKGLTLNETVSYLCAPDREAGGLRNDVLKPFAASAWYLHTSSDGKVFFKDTQNIVAKLKSMAGSYNRESQLRELRDFLHAIFDPSMEDCYQTVQALPSIDDIQVRPDKVTLVITEPYQGGKLNPQLRAWYDQVDYPNRILFLTGQRDTLERLLEIASELKAIKGIVAEMQTEKLPETDPQFASAQEILDTKQLSLLSAARETFTTLLFPFRGDLRSADFLMNFEDNAYNGEAQIRKTLKDKRKFTDEVDSDTFRKKLEDRLFTQKEMPWSEVKKRAAVETSWPWHRTDALDRLRDRMLREEQWIEADGYINREPPEPETTVRTQVMNRDNTTGEVTLKLIPVYGDTVYYEVGAPATTASQQVEDVKQFTTRELEVSFLCVDSNGEHDTGEPVTWKNQLTIQHRIYGGGNGTRLVELKAAPEAPILYTTNGSNPLQAGGTYEDPIPVTPETRMVLAVAKKNGLTSETSEIYINWEKENAFELDPDKPATWNREHQVTTTKDAYEFIDALEKHCAQANSVRINVTKDQDAASDQWMELMPAPDLAMTPGKLRQAVENLRALLEGGQVTLETKRLYFETGRHLEDWATDAKTELKPEEIDQ